jgi:transcriptional regulator with XRE-family HTH domain
VAVIAGRRDDAVMERVSAKSDENSDLAAMGRAIRDCRKEQRLSQEALADVAGIDRSHMGRIERGERNVTLLNLTRVSRALNVSLASLFEKAGL